MNCFCDLWYQNQITETVMKYLFVVLIAVLLFSCNKNELVFLKSPDKKIQLNFGINELSEIFYSVEFEDSVIIRPSLLGFQIEEESDFGWEKKEISGAITPDCVSDIPDELLADADFNGDPSAFWNYSVFQQ